MHIFTSGGIVLNKLKYLESDLIATILLKNEGKIKAIAKGGVNSRRRFPGSFEVGNIGEFGFTEKNPYQLMLITHSKIDDYLIKLKKDYEKTLMLIYLLGLTDVMIPEHQPNPKLFDTLLDSIQFLEHNKHLNQVRLFYELHLLKINGLLHVVDRCESCKTPFSNIKDKSPDPSPAWVPRPFTKEGGGGVTNVNLIVKTGRFVCSSCKSGSDEIHSMEMPLLEIIKSTAGHDTSLQDFSNVRIPAAIFSFTMRIISSYVDKPLKLWEMINTI